MVRQSAWILGLCLLDAILTLRVLGLGAIECNPAMGALLRLGPTAFIGLKLLWTLAGCGTLIALDRHRFARGGLCFLLVAYICLTGWHLVGQAKYAMIALS